jgi:hypothetical protein
MRVIRQAGLLAAIAAACTFGGNVAKFEPATVPGGATVTVTTATHPAGFHGELLAVEDTALLMISEDSVTRVPMRTVRSVRAPYGDAAGTPTAEQLAQLRLVARYPQGVDADLERRLLQAYHQGSVRVARP